MLEIINNYSYTIIGISYLTANTEIEKKHFEK